MKPFGFGVSFKATTNLPTDPNQTTKVQDPSNPEATFITTPSKINDSKERVPLDMATETFTPVKFGISTFKDQGQTLSSHRVEPEIKGLAELSETVETENFVEATTSHILGHWKYNTTVRLCNVKTNFIPTASTGYSTTEKNNGGKTSDTGQ